MMTHFYRLFLAMTVVKRALLIFALALSPWVHGNETGDVAMKSKKSGGENLRVISAQDRPLELSGCALVSGGLLVVEDELIGSVLFLEDIEAAPVVFKAINLEQKRFERKPHTKKEKLFPIQDFEDIATDLAERVYLLGSHEGKIYKKETVAERRPDREFLIQAKWDSKDRELKVQAENYTVLAQIVPVLKALGCNITFSDTVCEPAINIEGLAYHDGKLYLGLRSPFSPNGEAIMLIGNADGALSDAGYSGWEAVTLNLDGAGIRGMDWDPVKGRLLIVSGPGVDKKKGNAALWQCDAAGKDLGEILRFEKDIAKKGPEGVCRIAKGELLVVLDGEGDDSGGELVRIRD